MVIDEIRGMLEERARLFERAAALAPAVMDAARIAIASLERGGTVYACGNGGSATQAEHFVAELVGRFRRERRALRAVSLTDSTATITAIANDYGYADVFARQIAGVAREGDCLLALSTSGSSENVVRACVAAREAGARVIAVTGASGGRLLDLGDATVRVADSDTARIQEVHLTVIHLLCDLIERALTTPGGAASKPAP